MSEEIYARAIFCENYFLGCGNYIISFNHIKTFYGVVVSYIYFEMHSAHIRNVIIILKIIVRILSLLL